MKICNKLVLGILVMLAIMNITGCSSVANYKNSIFDDESKIINQGDSYTYLTRLGKSIGNEAGIEFTSFSGTDTIYRIVSDGENAVVFSFESIVDKGDFKVVLITPDDEVINIVDGIKEGSETILLKEGTSRIKLVGKKAKGEIKLKIESGENVDIKGADSH